MKLILILSLIFLSEIQIDDYFYETKETVFQELELEKIGNYLMPNGQLYETYSFKFNNITYNFSFYKNKVKFIFTNDKNFVINGLSIGKTLDKNYDIRYCFEGNFGYLESDWVFILNTDIRNDEISNFNFKSDSIFIKSFYFNPEYFEFFRDKIK